VAGGWSGGKGGRANKPTRHEEGEKCPFETRNSKPMYDLKRIRRSYRGGRFPGCNCTEGTPAKDTSCMHNFGSKKPQKREEKVTWEKQKSDDKKRKRSCEEFASAGRRNIKKFQVTDVNP